MSSVLAGASAPDVIKPKFSPPLIMPVRLRLERRKGFSLQAASRALNGLPARNVARPTRWGNPFHHAADGAPFSREAACIHFRAQIMRMGWYMPDDQRGGGAGVSIADVVHWLRGYNLACFCALDGRPCHADLLLLIANFSLDISGLGHVARGAAVAS